MKYALAAVGLILALIGCDQRPRAQVTRDVDGDTIHVTLNGHDETVRFIGVDTPETHKPGVPIQCFGPEAAAETARLLPPGIPVRLVYDNELRDRYGRLLAYVYREADNLFVNLYLAQQGFARQLTIAPDTDHADEIGEAVASAQAERLGLWAVC